MPKDRHDKTPETVGQYYIMEKVAQGGMADTEAGLDLWRLAALAHEEPETEAALGAEDAWETIRPRLEGTAHGRRFGAAWDQFMAEHGHHCRGELEFANPRWSVAAAQLPGGMASRAGLPACSACVLVHPPLS